MKSVSLQILGRKLTHSFLRGTSGLDSTRGFLGGEHSVGLRPPQSTDLFHHVRPRFHFSLRCSNALSIHLPAWSVNSLWPIAKCLWGLTGFFHRSLETSRCDVVESGFPRFDISSFTVASFIKREIFLVKNFSDILRETSHTEKCILSSVYLCAFWQMHTVMGPPAQSRRGIFSYPQISISTWPSLTPSPGGHWSELRPHTFAFSDCQKCWFTIQDVAFWV